MSLQIQEYRHCDKKLACNHAFPLTRQPKQIVCCADAEVEGESTPLRQGMMGWSSITTAGCAVPRGFFDYDDNWRTDGRTDVSSQRISGSHRGPAITAIDTTISPSAITQSRRINYQQSTPLQALICLITAASIAPCTSRANSSDYWLTDYRAAATAT